MIFMMLMRALALDGGAMAEGLRAPAAKAHSMLPPPRDWFAPAETLRRLWLARPAFLHGPWPSFVVSVSLVVPARSPSKAKPRQGGRRLGRWRRSLPLEGQGRLAQPLGDVDRLVARPLCLSDSSKQLLSRQLLGGGLVRGHRLHVARRWRPARHGRCSALALELLAVLALELLAVR